MGGGENTPVYRIDRVFGNNLYIKREDLIPTSFGGNKARKAQLFFREIDHGGYDCVVTYGSSSSNHCRVISNLAAAREIPCYIISPEEKSEETYNSVMMKNFKAEITVCPVCDVHDTIETKIKALEQRGYRPYFIAGGGHGNTGTQAYVNCYEEIRQYEKEHHCYFDYIFHASGTGTTQAGLVCGQLIHKEERKIIGISIARKKDVGREVILHSIKDYLYENKIDTDSDEIEKAVIFEDTYVGDGYGSTSPEIDKIIHFVLKQYGIPLDTTYTGKAFYGMMQHLKQNCISHKNVLFLHTGGTPLFFDDLKHTSGDWKGK